MKKILLILAMIAALVLPSRAESYTNEQIIGMCDTILNTPYDEDSPDRIQIMVLTARLIEWGMETKEVILDIGDCYRAMVKGLNDEQNGAMLGAYLAADIRYLLINGLHESCLESVQAAVREVPEYYKRADGRIHATRTLKRLCRLNEEQLNKYVAKKYKPGR